MYTIDGHALFIEFSARRPQLHRIIMQESKSDSERMDWLVDRHVRPLYDRVVAMFEQLSSDGVVPTAVYGPPLVVERDTVYDVAVAEAVHETFTWV